MSREHGHRIRKRRPQQAARRRALAGAINKEQNERRPHEGVRQQAAVCDGAAHHAAITERQTREQGGEPAAPKFAYVSVGERGREQKRCEHIELFGPWTRDEEVTPGEWVTDG